jgi:hypothetical protein
MLCRKVRGRLNPLAALAPGTLGAVADQLGRPGSLSALVSATTTEQLHDATQDTAISLLQANTTQRKYATPSLVLSNTTYNTSIVNINLYTYVAGKELHV